MAQVSLNTRKASCMDGDKGQHETHNLYVTLVQEPAANEALTTLRSLLAYIAASRHPLS